MPHKRSSFTRHIHTICWNNVAHDVDNATDGRTAQLHVHIITHASTQRRGFGVLTPIENKEIQFPASQIVAY